MADIRNLSTGKLRVGGSNYVLSSIMPQIIKQIQFQHPGIEFALVEERSFALRKLLEDGNLYLVIDSFDTDTLFCYGTKKHNVCLYALDSSYSHRDMGIFHRKNRYLSKAAQTFIKIAQAHFS